MFPVHRALFYCIEGGQVSEKFGLLSLDPEDKTGSAGWRKTPRESYVSSE